ncbi:MAG: hypothetical protein ACTH0S_04415 [Senegalia sp. (in: firmicutes)]
MSVKDFIIVLLASIFLNGILSGIYQFFINKIGGSPLRKHEANIEEIKSLKSHELQVDSYYRDISIKQVSTLIETWYQLVFDNEKLLTKNETKNLQLIKKVTNDTIAYGSRETIRILAVFQNYNYEHYLLKRDDDTTNESTFVGMYLMSYLISSLKKDFTGDGIDPNDLLKIKLTDYNKNKKLLLASHNKAKALLDFK